MRLTVKASGTSLEHFASIIGRLGSEAQVEMVGGLNDAGDRVRTLVRHAFQNQTSVLRYGTVVKVVKSRPASLTNPVYEIPASRDGLPITEFAVSTSKGSPVTAKVWGVDVTFQRSFVSSAKGELRAHVGAERLPIRALFGPAPYKELLKGQTLASFDTAVAELVEPMVFRRLVALAP